MVEDVTGFMTSACVYLCVTNWHRLPVCPLLTLPWGFDCVALKILFQKDEVFLNLVLEYVPETVYRVARHYSKSKQSIPVLYVKVSVRETAPGVWWWKMRHRPFCDVMRTVWRRAGLCACY